MALRNVALSMNHKNDVLFAFMEADRGEEYIRAN